MKKYSDELIRKLAIGTGLLTGFLFLFSMVALIEFPGMFIYLAIAMVLTAIVFFALRSVYNFRETFKIKK